VYLQNYKLLVYSLVFLCKNAVKKVIMKFKYRSAHPAAVKVAQASAPTSSSIYSFTNLKTGNQNATLNAKKLDVDFGGDDFFDSFGMTNNEPKETKVVSNDNPFSLAEGSKKEESGPFQLGSGINSNTKTTPQDDEFIKKKLKELEGKKAISSEDFKQIDKDE